MKKSQHESVLSHQIDIIITLWGIVVHFMGKRENLGG